MNECGVDDKVQMMSVFLCKQFLKQVGMCCKRERNGANIGQQKQSAADDMFMFSPLSKRKITHD